MTDQPPRELRVALISFMTAASAALLLVWTIIGSIFGTGAMYLNVYVGFAIFLFLPAMLAGLVAALAATAAMKLASRYGRVPGFVWAGVGAFVSYGAIALVVMPFLTQGLFSASAALVSAAILGLIASSIVHLWHRRAPRRAAEEPQEPSPIEVGLPVISRVQPAYSDADFEKVRVLDAQIATLHRDLKAIYDDNTSPEEYVPTYYLAMGEYAFWATAHADSQLPVVQTMLQMLEAANQTGEEIIEECISVMFLENLIGEPQMIALLAPSLRRQMGRILGEWAP